MISITRRQYLISAARRELPEMCEIHLSCGAYLYVGEDLKINYLEDAEKRKYTVLGNVFCVDAPGKCLEESVATFRGQDVNELVKNWTGRWLVIRDGGIQIDATGLMAAFYTTDRNWCISSSLALIGSVTGQAPSRGVANQGLTWQLLPETLMDDVKCLLCTQKIEISEGTVSIIFNPWIEDYRNLGTQEKVSKIANLLKAAIVNIERFSEREVWIALTAGKDSRLVLAAALAANIKFVAYTSDHDNISSSDKLVPAKIAKDLGFLYKFIKARKIDRGKIVEYELFTAGNSKGADELFYARGQFDKIPSNAIVVRGGLFEAGQQYARKTAGSEPDSFRRGIESYYRSSLTDPRQKQAFAKWLKYVDDNPISFLDIRDRMYLEQRVGGWAAAIEQALDINKWISIQIANSRSIVAILLSATTEERACLSLSYDTISLLKSELCKYPFNKPSIKDRIRIVKNVLLSPEKMKHNIKRLFR